MRACGSGEARNAEKTARGGQAVPPGRIFGWARGSIGRGRIARGGAPSGKGGVVHRSTKFTTGEGVARTDDGRPGRVGHAGTILERRHVDAGGTRGALAEDDTSSRPAKRTPARVSGADARRCIFSCDGLATRASFLHLTRALPTPARLPRRSPRQQPLSGLNTAHLEVRHASFGFRDRSLPHARRLRHIPAPPPPTRTSSPPKIARARTRVFVSFLTVRSRLPQSLLGQEVVITLGDASTRQGTVCDVDRRGTVALRKVRPSGAGAPTRAPLVRGKRRDFGENVRGAQGIGKRRFAAAVVAAAEDFFSNEALFGALRLLRPKKKKLTSHPRPLHHSRDRR